MSDLEDEDVAFNICYLDENFKKRYYPEEIMTIKFYLLACYDYLTCIFDKSAVDEVYSNLAVYLVECGALTEQQVKDNKDRINDMLSRIEYTSYNDSKGYHFGMFEGVRSNWTFSASGDGDFVYGLADVVSGKKGTYDNPKANSYDINNYNIYLGANYINEVVLVKILYHEVGHFLLSSDYCVLNEGFADRLSYLISQSVAGSVNTGSEVCASSFENGSLYYWKKKDDDIACFLNCVEANLRAMVGEDFIHCMYALLGNDDDKELANDLFYDIYFSEDIIDAIDSISMFFDGFEERDLATIKCFLEKQKNLLERYNRKLKNSSDSDIGDQNSNTELENTLKNLARKIELLEIGSPLTEFYRMASITNACLQKQIETLDSSNNASIIHMMLRLSSLKNNGLIAIDASGSNPTFDEMYSLFVNSYFDENLLEDSGILALLEVEQFRTGKINDVFLKCEEVNDSVKTYGLYVDAVIPSYYSLTNNQGIVNFKSDEPKDISEYLDLGYRSIVKKEEKIDVVESSNGKDNSLKYLVK